LFILKVKVKESSLVAVGPVQQFRWDLRVEFRKIRKDEETSGTVYKLWQNLATKIGKQRKSLRERNRRAIEDSIKINRATEKTEKQISETRMIWIVCEGTVLADGTIKN